MRLHIFNRHIFACSVVEAHHFKDDTMGLSRTGTSSVLLIFERVIFCFFDRFSIPRLPQRSMRTSVQGYRPCSRRDATLHSSALAEVRLCKPAGSFVLFVVTATNLCQIFGRFVAFLDLSAFLGFELLLPFRPPERATQIRREINRMNKSSFSCSTSIRHFPLAKRTS